MMDATYFSRRVQVICIVSSLLSTVVVIGLLFAMDTDHVNPMISYVTTIVRRPQPTRNANGQPITAHVSDEQSSTESVTNGNYKVTCNVIGLNRICQYGSIRPGRKHAVYGSSLFDHGSLQYTFDLPLSALAWNRSGFDSIVLIFGDLRSCGNGSQLVHVVETLKALPYVVLLVIEGIDTRFTVTVSQTARLLLPSFIQDPGPPTAWNGTYLLTADADIWPINCHYFDLPPGKDILHGDISGAKVPDVHKRANVPLSFVGMKVHTWNEVMSQSGFFPLPNTTLELIRFFAHVFGEKQMVRVQHGGRGWGVDQAMASKRIQTWKDTQKNGPERVYIYPRDKADRIDRARWKPVTLENMVDAHILTDMYKASKWASTRTLLKLMYKDSSTLNWCERYAKTFRELATPC